MPTIEQFNDAVMAKIEEKAVATLSGHPKTILDAALYATGRVFVSKPEDDTPEAKKANTVALLRNLADALENEANPLEFEYKISEDHKYNGHTYNITKAVAKDLLLPAPMIARSADNRVKTAADKLS